MQAESYPGNLVEEIEGKRLGHDDSISVGSVRSQGDVGSGSSVKSSEASPSYEFPPGNLLFTHRPKLPVLIIPGFMSSGLYVKSSDHAPDWVNQRVWISLAKLGMGTLFKTSKVEVTARARHTNGHEAAIPPPKEEHFIKRIFHGGGQNAQVQKLMQSHLHLDEEDFQSEENAKTHKWLHHMCVNAEDGFSDPPGIEVRPLEGLEGVDFLEPGAITGALSYVFAHVIKELKKVGYVPDVNLRAAPYDWRIIPRKLEERDFYFQRLVVYVEEMYEASNQTPVVLLGHSMGTRCIQFFLHMVKYELPLGQAWIDKYIHSFVAVGPLWLGAPKAIRGIVNGDKMGLETFLNDEQALVMGRSLGSSCWCLPVKDWAAGFPIDLPPATYTRIEGYYKLEIFTANFKKRVKKDETTFVLVEIGRKNYIDSMLQKRRLNTKEATGRTPTFNEAFEFVSEHPDRISPDEYLTIKVKRSKGMVANVVGTQIGLRWSQSSVAETAVCLPVLMKGKLEFSGALPLSGGVDIHIRVVFVPHAQVANETFSKAAAYGAPARLSEPSHRWHPSHRTNHRKVYEPWTNTGAMALDGIDAKLRHWNDHYWRDPLFGYAGENRPPRVFEAPPCRVKAIYGINLETEISAFYRRKNFRKLAGGLNSSFKMDKSAIVAGDTSILVKNGVASETKITQQRIPDTGEVKKISGDGTVPYLSMRFCKTWEKQGTPVEVVELDAADHRQILADKRFLAVLLQHVTTSPDIIIELHISRATDLVPVRQNGSADPYVKVYYENNRITTDVGSKTLSPAFSRGTIRIGFERTVPTDASVELQAKDKDVLKHHILGSVSVDLYALYMQGGRGALDLPLDKGGMLHCYYIVELCGGFTTPSPVPVSPTESGQAPSQPRPMYMYKDAHLSPSDSGGSRPGTPDGGPGLWFQEGGQRSSNISGGSLGSSIPSAPLSGYSNTWSSGQLHSSYSPSSISPSLNSSGAAGSILPPPAPSAPAPSAPPMAPEVAEEEDYVLFPTASLPSPIPVNVAPATLAPNLSVNGPPSGSN